jgi:hypothetical protein
VGTRLGHLRPAGEPPVGGLVRDELHAHTNRTSTMAALRREPGKENGGVRSTGGTEYERVKEKGGRGPEPSTSLSYRPWWVSEKISSSSSNWPRP